MNKKISLFLILIILVSVLTGCQDKVEIEDRDFIQTMMVTKEDGDYNIYYGLPDLSAITGQNTNEVEKTMAQYKAVSMTQVEEQYNLEGEKRLDYSHLKAIVIDSKLGKDPEKLTQFLKYIQSNYELSRNTAIYITYNDISEIAKLNGNVNGGIGGYLENLFRNTEGKGKNLMVTIGDVLTAYCNRDENVIIPVIAISNDTICLNGGAIYNGKSIDKYVTEDDYLMLMLALGKGESNRLYIKDTALQLEETKSQISFNKDVNYPKITVGVSGVCSIREGDSLRKTALNQWIENNMSAVLGDCYSNQTDPLNLYRLTGIKSRTLWKRYKDRHNEFIKDTTIQIVSDFSIRE